MGAQLVSSSLHMCTPLSIPKSPSPLRSVDCEMQCPAFFLYVRIPRNLHRELVVVYIVYVSLLHSRSVCLCVLGEHRYKCHWCVNGQENKSICIFWGHKCTLLWLQVCLH